MTDRLAWAFRLVVVAQAAHSIEEYATRLYDVFPPARFLSSLVSSDLATGFALLNAALVAFGFWCYAVPVRGSWPSARGIALGWAAVEIANGLGHLALATANGGYFPGVATAPVLLGAGGWLAFQLAQTSPARRGMS